MATQISNTNPLILGSGSSGPTSELQNPSVTTTNISAIRYWISLVMAHTHTYTDIIQTGYQASSTTGTTGVASGFTSLAPLNIAVGQLLNSSAFNDMIAALQSGISHSHTYTDSSAGASTTSVATNPIPLPAPVSPGSPVLESARAQLVAHIAWYSGHTHTYVDTFTANVAPPQPLHYVTGTPEDPQSTPTTITYTCAYGSYYDMLTGTNAPTHSTTNNLLPQGARCAGSVTGCDTCSCISQIYTAANTTGGVPYYVSTSLKADDNNVLLLFGYPSNLVGTQSNTLVVQVKGPPGHTVYVLAPETDLWGNIYVGATLRIQGRTWGSGTCNYEDQGDLWVYQFTLDGNGDGQFGMYSTAQNGGKFMIGIVDATATGMSDQAAVANCFGINNYLCNAVPWSMGQANSCLQQNVLVGGSCFPAGSQVLMPDLTTKNIEDIVEGELVMGANGMPVAVEIMDRVTLSYNRNGGVRKLFTMKDGSLMWSEEHLFWSKDTTAAEWWWGTDPDQWRHEVFTDHVVGLKDNYSVRQGDGIVLAHLDGWKDLDYDEVPGMGPDLPLFLPRCDGTPIIVNGYVVTAGTNEFRFDYSQFKWDPEKVKAVQQ